MPDALPPPLPAVTLSGATLGDLPVPVPQYDRAGLRPGIVHLGVGGFFRAHQAVYLDRLLAAGDRDWGVVGIGTQPGDRRMRDVLQAQDHLYTVVEKHPDGRLEPRVVGALIGMLHAPDDPDAAVEQLASPDTRIVSLTITEGGYGVDPEQGVFLAADPEVRRDLARGEAPRTVFGLVAEALRRRRERGLGPFTVMSCDNVQGNGAVARTAFAGFAELRDPELGAWVREHVAFPSSMVDRITPTTTDDDRAALAALGVRDAWPVVCEPYLQWVLEDDVVAGRPDWDRAGVQLVADVHPYEQLKLRLLNAGHQAVGHLGRLAGHTYADEVVRDPDLAGLLEGYLEREATPTLAPVPGIDVPAYRRSLLERFGNRHVRDTVARLCAYASDRVPAFLLPVVRDQLARGGEVDRAALVVAAWARGSRGVDEHGRAFEVVDRQLETVRAAADDPDPVTFLHDTGVFGALASDPVFVAAYREQHGRLAGGVRAAARALRPGD